VVQPIDLPPILRPLEPFRDQLLMLKGVHDKVQGDGDRHMRGMGCLLTGIELFPGNIQGGGETPAGWSSGLSIDQEIKNFFQSQPMTRTRFGSLEFGVGVQDRADPWTRMSYAGSGQPVAPISDPYQMYQKLYGQLKDKENGKACERGTEHVLGVGSGFLLNACVECVADLRTLAAEGHRARASGQGSGPDGACSVTAHVSS
jgi:hypothetical protein